MTKKQKREWAMSKALSILTMDNGTPSGKICALHDKLEQCDQGDLAMIIASEYSPEGRITWQQFMELQLPLMTNYVAA